LAWCSLLPVFICIVFGTVIAFRRDLFTVSILFCYFADVLIDKCTRYLCFNIFVVVCDTVPWGMPSSIFLCLFQARINWEGCGRKGIQRKNRGDDGGGSLTSSLGVAPSRTVGVSASVIFRCTIKPRRRWLAKVRLLCISPSVPPHAYTSTRWGNPARTQHNPRKCAL